MNIFKQKTKKTDGHPITNSGCGPNGKRSRRFHLFSMMLMLLMMAIPAKMNAASLVGNIGAKESSVDFSNFQSQGYITVKFTYYDSFGDGKDEWLDDGFIEIENYKNYFRSYRKDRNGNKVRQTTGDGGPWFIRFEKLTNYTTIVNANNQHADLNTNEEKTSNFYTKVAHVQNQYYSGSPAPDYYTNNTGRYFWGTKVQGTNKNEITVRVYIWDALTDRDDDNILNVKIGTKTVVESEDPNVKYVWNYKEFSYTYEKFPHTSVDIYPSNTIGKLDAKFTYPSGYDMKYAMIKCPRIGWTSLSLNRTVTEAFDMSQEPQVYQVRTNMWAKNEANQIAERYDFHTSSNCVLNKHIPAYVWPDSITSSYDTKGYVNINFKMPYNPESYYNKIEDFFTGDEIEIQRATKPDFSDAVTLPNPIPYDYKQVDYSYRDDVRKENLKGDVYYRFRRTLSKNKWGWDYCVKDTIKVNSALSTITNLTAVVDTVKNKEVPYARLNWKFVEKIWPENSVFRIVAHNKTTGQKSNIADLNLEDARKGVYYDEALLPCNKMNYSMQLILPHGTNFTQPIPIMAKGDVLTAEIGKISGLEVSKGYFSDRVDLKWKVDGGFDAFRIRRVEYSLDGSKDTITIDNINSTASEVMLASDTKGNPGVYYRYIVDGMVVCDKVPVYSNVLSSIGFRSPTGSIYGQLTYEDGQAVPFADVLIRSDQPLGGQSMHFDGKDDYLQVNKNIDLKDEFTLQAYIYPETTANGTILSKKGVFDLEMVNGTVKFTAGGKSVSALCQAKKNCNFVHVSAVKKHNELRLFIDSIAKDSAFDAAVTEGANAPLFIGAKENKTNCYRGYIDEVRIWNEALTAKVIVRDYCRLLWGGEKGLQAYWRFNEGIVDEFYDLSCTGNDYHQHHGVISGATYSNNIPTESQLSLKGVTDQQGNYSISGIPYTGQGTTYYIIPKLGTHQFEPAQHQRMMANGALSHTCDFKDKSSFEVRGTVYYVNTTIPVADVNFQVDGQTLVEHTGKPAATNAKGEFTISVPVGFHSVCATKANHKFVNGGKIVDKDGKDFNFQEPMQGFELQDSTFVKVIGRVAGGPVQGEYPLGHSLSKNNLSDDVTVTFTLSSGGQYVVNNTGQDLTKTELHHRPSYLKEDVDWNKTNEVVFASKSDQIQVKPNKETGEFVAYLFPLNYKASVKAKGHTKVIDDDFVSVDLTKTFVPRYSEYTHKEEIVKPNVINPAKNDTSYVEYKDSVKYNQDLKFIQRQSPSMEFVQLVKNKPVNYFGDDVQKSTDINGKKQEVTAWNGSKYTFGKPVFTQGQNYKFRLSAFEEYKYYENTSGSPVLKKTDRVPVTDGMGNFNNALSTTAAVDTAKVDKDGHAFYEFTAGDPAIGSTGLKQMTVFLEVPGSTIAWNNGEGIKAYVLGGKAKGTRFVTKGPDRVKMILRDPHGSHSYSYLEEGATLTTTDKYVGSIENNGTLDFQAETAPTLMSWIGVGAGIITVAEGEMSATNSVIHRETMEGSVGTVDAQTYTTRFQTSDDPQYVGSDGDLFIGNSTNISYGEADNLHIVPNETYNSNTGKYTFVADGGNYKIVQSRGLAFTPEYTTMFAYPQAYIENALLPELEELRNTYILDYTTSPTAAQEKANNLQQQVYVSKLARDDKNFGSSNTDEDVWGEKATVGFEDGPSYKIYVPAGKELANDTVMAYNEQIKNWIGLLAQNEKEKVEAKLFKNYSFQAGASVEYSEEYSHATVNTQEFHIGIGWGIQTSAGFKVNKAGMTMQVHNEAVTTHGGSFEQQDQTSKKVGFVLADEGSTDFLSVDVCRPMIETPLGIKMPETANFIFKLKGGATSCPYEEGYVTKYYEPGKHVIDEPTVAVEAPKIEHVGLPEVIGVPSTRRAAFKIRLINNSGTKSDQVYDLHVVEGTNPNGAKFYIDGAALGNGRSFLVPYGQPLVKTLEVAMGPEATEYKDLQLVFHSQCQFNTLDFKDNIADVLHLSATFVPACTDIQIDAPGDNWVLNAKKENFNESEECYFMPITVKGYDINFPDFKCVKLKYKPSSASEKEWTTVMTYYVNEKFFNEATEVNKQMLPKSGSFDYEFLFKDMPDQRYDLCAVAECIDSKVKTVSNIVSGLKDTKLPTLFGTPQPSDGVLRAGEDIYLKFNEEIAEGLIVAQNISVTGVRNGKVLTRDASLRFDGQNDYLATEATKNFNGKSFTIDLAYRVEQLNKEMTLFSQGNINNALEIGLTPQKQVKVKMGAQSFVSDPVDMKLGSWEHLAVVFDNERQYLTVYQNSRECIETPATTYTGEGHYEIGRSLTTGGNYFEGQMSELRVWNKALSDHLLTDYKNISLKGSEIGLLSYYPMDECRGNVALDKARGMNATIKDAQWNINRKGHSVQFNGTSSYVALNTAAATITKDQDFTIEFWFKAAPGQRNVALVANGRGDNQEEGGSRDKLYIGFDANGKLVTIGNGKTVAEVAGNYLDNAWHHYALTVQRNSQAKVYMDGQQMARFDATDLANVASGQTYLGARGYLPKGEYVTPTFDQFFKGYIDDFRMWKLSKNETMVNQESNVNLAGDEMGLMAYYPFETYIEANKLMQMDFTLNDMKVRKDTDPVVAPAKSVNAVESTDIAPIKDRGPVEKIPVDWVVNKDAMIITPTLSNGWDNYEQSVITIAVSDIQDLSRNRMASTLAWTAYIDRNQLVWNEDELNVSANVNEGLEFTVDIANIGGTVQHYSIQNQPSWLEVSAPEGSIQPQKNQQITFNVDKGLNVGTYNEVLYLVNEGGVARPMSLNVKVKGERPDWNVDPNAYKYNMSIFGEMFFNGIPSNDAEDLVGVFKDGKCVGLSNSTYDKKRDMWYTYITVYTNEMETTERDVKDVYEFRLWDTSTGQLFLGEVDQLVFKNGNCGSIKNLLQIKGKEMKFRNVNLESGWNWVSFAVLPSASTNSNMLLKNGSWKNDDVIKNVAGFDTYSEEKQQWVGTIGNTYDKTQMYMLHASNAQHLYINGTESAGMSVKVEGQKWNFIGYTPTFNLTVNEAMAGYKAVEGDIIKSQSQFAMYTDGDWVGSLKYMEVNKGYMLLRNAANTVSFTYPSTGGSFSRTLSWPMAKTTAETDDFCKKYANNLTIVATPSYKDLQDGDIIEAYINGELRGRSQIVIHNDESLHFLTIAGNEADGEIVFSLVRDGEEIAKSSTVVPFKVNAIQGSVTKATEISFDNTEDKVSLYPNPFVSQLNIQFYAEKDGQAEISIYDMAGRLMMQKALQAHAGVNKYTWNGVGNQGAVCAGGVHIVRVTVDGQTTAHEVIKK